MPNRVQKRWTLEELHSLPDDGNKYELVHGELFVTPAPTPYHETILARLSRILEAYVAANGLGYVFHPRAVIRLGDDTEVEPDLMVRHAPAEVGATWVDVPLPILVVEVASASTRHRDRVDKRNAYAEAGIAEYWLVDGRDRTVRVVRLGGDDFIATDSFDWYPTGGDAPLAIRLVDVFGPTANSSLAVEK
ncbi:MAG TPA: Uma2 family endonuclease [Gemmatimonadaceae bacterium]|jgi:Uma2 family endonuclease|nr:Uma2 family endonuclease [Gemmatimonadaceae bacterium]